MSENKEIWMETTHGRKSKCKTEFKAVVNKVLISTLVITTLMSSVATPAMAATVNNGSFNHNNSTAYTQEYGVTVQASIQNIQNTINTINSMRAKGTVSYATIKTLATQLYSLESAAKASGEGGSDRIVAIIDKAEIAIAGLKNASDAEVAISVVRATLGIKADSVTVENNKSVVQEKVKSFKDVPSSHWAHSAIMKMVDLGMFAGTTTPVNGVGTFSPDTTMTRAQFITVVTRYMYNDELTSMKTVENADWWANNYTVALKYGLVTQNEMPSAEMNKGISRQEMAMVLVRAAEAQGETIPGGVSNSRIADYSKIGSYYKDYVKQCFAMGMIKGYDEQGTFGPQDTVTRAQGAVVLYRLVNAETRDPEVSTGTQVQQGQQGSQVQKGDGTNVNDYRTEVGVNYDQMYADWAANQKNITIKYGQARYNRPAVAGDTYIKKDGTSIVLKMGPSGVVGEGQGVPADLGLVWGKVNVKAQVVHVNGEFRYDTAVIGDDQCGLTQAGTPLMGETYLVNKSTGEGHFAAEWGLIVSNEIYRKYIDGVEGKYDGQVSSDPLKLWVWNAAEQEWDFNFAR